MKYLRMVVVSLCLLFALGCSESSSIEGLVTAKGVVTHNGTPLEGATIQLHPTEGGRPVFANSGEQGAFELFTMRPGDGAKPGKYHVTVAKSEVVGAMTDEEYERYVDREGREPPPAEKKSLIPEKYASKDTSEMTVTISDSGEENLEIKLED